MDYLHKLFGLTKAEPVEQQFVTYQDYDFIPAKKSKDTLTGMLDSEFLTMEFMNTDGFIW
jgi:hypothetical protein